MFFDCLCPVVVLEVLGMLLLIKSLFLVTNGTPGEPKQKGGHCQEANANPGHNVGPTEGNHGDLLQNLGELVE